MALHSFRRASFGLEKVLYKAVYQRWLELNHYFKRSYLIQLY